MDYSQYLKYKLPLAKSLLYNMVKDWNKGGCLTHWIDRMSLENILFTIAIL